MVLAAPSTPTATVRGAASNAIADLLAGTPESGQLIGTYPVATYVETAGGVVAVVTHDAVRLPNAIVVDAADLARVAMRGSGGRADIVVGDGHVRVGDVSIIVGRWWDPVPRVATIDAAAVTRRLDQLRGLLPAWPEADDPAGESLVAGRDRLALGLESGRDIEDAANSLVGLGPGLTPAGDDVVAGAIAALVVFGRAHPDPAIGVGVADVAGMLAAAAARCGDRTTVLAADLTRLAAVGALAEPAAGLCQALAGDRELEPAVRRLMTIGHTSGRDLAEGMLVGSTAWARRVSA